MTNFPVVAGGSNLAVEVDADGVFMGYRPDG
jgi:hypothetical protein